jgi:hypothetical protein
MLATVVTVPRFLKLVIAAAMSALTASPCPLVIVAEAFSDIAEAIICPW